MHGFQNFFFSRHLDDDEVVDFLVHKHWIIGLKSLFVPSIALIVLSLITGYVQQQYVSIGGAFIAVWLLVWWLRNFLDYYLDAWIVTNKGILIIEWHGWFHRESTRILFSDVEGVGYEIQGVLGTIFNVGTLSIERISTGSAVSISNVKKPKRAEGIIMKNMENYVLAKNLKDAKTVQNILTEFVTSSIQSEKIKK